MTIYHAIALFLGCGILACFRPITAVSLLVIGAPSYLFRTTLLGIPTTALEVGMLGTLAGYATRNIMAIAAGKNVLRLHWDRLLQALPKLALVFLGMAFLGWIIATVFSVDQRASVGAIKSWFIEPLLIGLMLLSERPTAEQRRHVERSILIALSWVSLAGFLQLGFFRETVEDGRLSSVFWPVANYFAMFVSPLVVYAFGMAMQNRLRRFAIASVVMGIGALTLSVSYGGLLASATGIVVILATQLDQRKRRRALLASLFFLVAIFVAFLPTRYFSEKINFSSRSSSLVRTQIWRTAVEIGFHHPFFGIGPGAFEKEYRRVAPTLYHPPLEWLVAKPHNLYLNLWVETGILGLFGTSLLLFLFIRRTLRCNVTIASAAAIIAITTHGLVDTPLFKNDLALLAVVIVVLGFIASVHTSE